MDENDAKHLLDKIPNRQFVPMLAYVLIMAIIAATGYALIFHEAKLPKMPHQSPQEGEEGQASPATNAAAPALDPAVPANPAPTAAPILAQSPPTSVPPPQTQQPSSAALLAQEKKRDGLSLQWKDYWLHMIPFLGGILALVALGFVCYRFYTRFPLPDPALVEVLNSAHLPIIITKKRPLKTHFANARALDFYDTQQKHILNKGPVELDELIKAKMGTTDWNAWEAEHKKRAEEAEKHELKSSSKEMKLNCKLLGADKWRLTTSLFLIEGDEFYLTIYSPAEEVFEVTGTGNTGSPPPATA